MGKVKYFVCYKLDGVVKDRVVTLVDDFPVEEIAERLRNRIHPNHPGDLSDNMKPQFSNDCLIINFQKLDN